MCVANLFERCVIFFVSKAVREKCLNCGQLLSLDKLEDHIGICSEKKHTTEVK